VPLCLVILLKQSLRNDFNLGVFGGFHGKVFLRVDFRFLLIEWVLGTELLAKGSPRGTLTNGPLLLFLNSTSKMPSTQLNGGVLMQFLVPEASMIDGAVGSMVC
jgi:hypothetical protein